MFKAVGLHRSDLVTSKIRMEKAHRQLLIKSPLTAPNWRRDPASRRGSPVRAGRLGRRQCATAERVILSWVWKSADLTAQ